MDDRFMDNRGNGDMVLILVLVFAVAIFAALLKGGFLGV